MDKALNKKEYLKKYLAGGGDKKRKKKAAASKSVIKSKIIDDDLDLRLMKPVDDRDVEIHGLGEDAPQIAGIIDERPEEIRVMSEYRETKKWKMVTREYEDVDISEIKGSDSDLSPSREILRKDTAVPRKHLVVPKDDSDSDISLERRNVPKGKVSDVSVHRRNVSKNDSDSDVSVSRKNIKSDRTSFRRRSASQRKPGYTSEGSDTYTPSKHVKNTSHSVPKREDSASSLRRKRRHDNSDSENSPSTSKKSKKPSYIHSGQSTSSQLESKAVPSQKHRGNSKVSRTESPKLSKTLDGKKAGLQDASELRKEISEIRHQQARSLAQLGDELSGRGATAIFRDKKTGRKRDLKEEAKERRKREEKEEEVAAKYAVWGKGVKQVDDKQNKMKEELHEMSKPFARYADDEDLEDMLRNEEKEGDPMLEFLRNKKQKEGKSVARPQYQGSYMPNRYSIKPGHRWDGVDRSNGYEKKFFEEMSSRKAREEEAFKWSTEDM